MSEKVLIVEPWIYELLIWPAIDPNWSHENSCPLDWLDDKIISTKFPKGRVSSFEFGEQLSND